MEFHPKYIVPTAIYVAGKVEEQYINVDTIAEQLHVDHKHVIGHEMVLLEGVRFQLIMYHPFRAVLGFVDDFRGFRKSQGRDLPLDALQKLHANSCVVLNELLLTELPLCHYPAYLSLAAVRHVAQEMESDPKSGVSKSAMDEYIQRSKFSQGKDLDAVHAQLDLVLKRYGELKDQQTQREQDPVVAEKHAKQIKKVYKKLKAFHVEEGGGNGGKKEKKEKDSKKRKSGDDGGSKKDKKKSKKDKKEKK
jgi:cyclin H